MFARNWCPTRRPTRSTRVAVRRDVARLERKAEISWRDRCRRSKPRSTAASHTSVTRYSYPPIDRWTTRESREKKTLIDGLFGDGPIYNVWQSGSSYVTECDYKWGHYFKHPLNLQIWILNWWSRIFFQSTGFSVEEGAGNNMEPSSSSGAPSSSSGVNTANCSSVAPSSSSDGSVMKQV